MSIDTEISAIEEKLYSVRPIEDKLQILYKLKNCFESAFNEFFPGKTLYHRGDFRIKAFVNGVGKDKLNVNVCILGNDNVITVDVEHKIGSGEGEIEIVEC